MDIFKTGVVVFGVAIAIGGIHGAISGISSEMDRQAATQKAWEGATVVKICRDGSTIYRLKSGEFRSPSRGIVEDPMRVCAE